MLLTAYISRLQRYARKAHQLCGPQFAAAMTPIPWPVTDMDSEGPDEDED